MGSAEPALGDPGEGGVDTDGHGAAWPQAKGCENKV